MSSSHVWVTRFSIVRAHLESGYAYQRYPITGFRCCNPGARHPYTPSAAAGHVAGSWFVFVRFWFSSVPSIYRYQTHFVSFTTRTF
jgi:hypothetical protein